MGEKGHYWGPRCALDFCLRLWTSENLRNSEPATQLLAGQKTGLAVCVPARPPVEFFLAEKKGTTVVLWMDELLHHLRNPGMLIPLQIMLTLD